MKKSVSIFTITVVGIMSVAQTYGAPMTPQIQRLLDQKEEKVKKLEECEGKKQGWMIAGISTIGLTAVGVGVNIAQASKSNRLSNEIDATKTELERQERNLSEINSQIAQKEREKAERERAEHRGKENEQWNGAVVGNICGNTEAAKWTIVDNGTTECLSESDGKRYMCECSAVGEIIPMSFGDKQPDGKIGEVCDDGKGTWVTTGEKMCVDADNNGVQDCHCEPKANNATKGDEENPGNLMGKPKQKDPKACDEGYIRIKGKGDCVKVDYVLGHGYTNAICKCDKGSADCKLVKDDNGPLVCQTGKDHAEKCDCVDASRFGNGNATTGITEAMQGNKPGTLGINVDGSRFGNGNATTGITEAMQGNKPGTLGINVNALPVTSGNCAGITQCNNVKTFIPKTEEELKCLKQNCDNIGGKWQQERKMTYICGC